MTSSDRIIIDTNLWISFLLSKDYSKLDKLLSSKEAVLLFSKELLEEFIDVVSRTKLKKYFSQSDLNNLLDAIDKVAVFIDVKSTVNACRDKKDDFLLSLAKDGNATHLLTGDKDLLALIQFEKTFILTISDYLKSKSTS
jgi:putative PIN family toxin of toxin-antitoxin system